VEEASELLINCLNEQIEEGCLEQLDTEEQDESQEDGRTTTKQPMNPKWLTVQLPDTQKIS
jgi:hypothetical protein